MPLKAETIFESLLEWPHRGTGSEDEMMARDLSRHFTHGEPLPVSVVDALVAGLTAMKLDEARREGRVLDLTDLWKRFDSYKLS